MSKPTAVERDLLVFAIWAVFGLGALAFLLEAFAQDSYVIGLAGVTAVMSGFTGHIIVNSLTGTGFRSGEIALGIGTFGILALGFIFAWLGGALSQADYYSGLTFFGVLAFGLPIYVSSRLGLRGAFSQFHLRRSDQETTEK